MTTPRFCPSCGAARIEGDRFCSGCGADLAAPGVPSVLGSPVTEPQVPLAIEVPPAPPPVAVRSAVGDSRSAPDERPARRRPLLVLGLVAFLVIAAGVGVGAVLLLKPSAAPCPVPGSPFRNPVTLTSPSAGPGGWSLEISFKGPSVTGTQVQSVLAVQGYPNVTVAETSDGYLRLWNSVPIPTSAFLALEAQLGPIMAQRAVPTAQTGPTLAPSVVCDQVVYRLQPVNAVQPDAGALATTQTIIENRVNSTGVTGATVDTFGTDTIVVTFPSRGDADEIRALLVQTGRFDFIPLPPAEYGTGSSPGTYQAVEGQPLPTTERPLFGGDQIDQAYPTTDQTGLRAVGFRLKSTGSQLFANYTSKHVGEFFAIVLDGNVVSAPVIQSAITGGTGIITGGGTGFTAAQMNNLITVLNYGSLPFPLKEESSTEIGTP